MQRIKMEIIFMNTENSGTNERHRFELDLADKLSHKNPGKNMGLANLSIYYTWKNTKPEYNNNKFKISAPNWNDTFDLPDGSYSIDDVQDYFEYIIKKHEIVFKIKTGSKLELLSPEIMRLLRSIKRSC